MKTTKRMVDDEFERQFLKDQLFIRDFEEEEEIFERLYLEETGVIIENEQTKENKDKYLIGEVQGDIKQGI